MSSLFDEDIKRSIWEGKIPIIFTLSTDDLTSHLPPAPYALMAPRNTYFPLITNIVKDYFSSSTMVIREMWLEYKGIPLKWHVPIGVLFDQLVELNPNEQHSYWNIIVHFQSYPEKILMKCSNDDSVKTYYKNVLKEANYTKYGDVSKINNLTMNQSNELWDGLKLHDFDKFWSINKLFYSSNINGYKSIPLRIIFNYKPPIQEIIPSVDENGNELTLSHLFYRVPFGAIQQNLIYTNSTSNTPPMSPTSSSSSLLSMNQAIELQQIQTQHEPFINLLQYIQSSPTIKYKIQGLEPSLDTPLTWLYEYFSCPDNFLYIVISDSLNFSISSILQSLLASVNNNTGNTTSNTISSP